jgi:hypothetical protein
MDVLALGSARPGDRDSGHSRIPDSEVSCEVTSWTAASDVDIDHIVPLKKRVDLRRLGLDHGEA